MNQRLVARAAAAVSFFLSFVAGAQELRINEFTADNTDDILQDEDGEASDWIEVLNAGGTLVNLAGYSLSDDAEDPKKWEFPARDLPAGGYLIVFASGKNRSPLDGELHAGFKLSADGEPLLLSRVGAGGAVETISSFLPSFPGQREGISYGIGSDGMTPGYFAEPTPGAANGESFLGFVKDTSFSVDRGFYSAPISVEITTLTPEATIRYTTDGSEPTPDGGTVYTGAVAVSSTTTLRAAAFKEGFQPSNTDTHTYLFLADIRTQYADGAAPEGWPERAVNGQVYDYGMDPDITDGLTAEAMDAGLTAIPSLCLSISQEDLTGRRGIYSNPGQRGTRWEKPASLELINPDGSRGFQVGCGLRIRGGASRNVSNPKHAFRVFFRKEYGVASLDFPLFGGEGASTFEKIDIRTAQNYSWSKDGDRQNTFLREVLGRDLQREMNQPYTRSRYYHLYLNGVYWGLFMTQERSEADFGATYLGGDPDSFDTVKSGGSSQGYLTEATDGYFEKQPAPEGGEIDSDWRTLWEMARAQEAEPTLARYYEMQGLAPNGARDPALPVFLDVDNLIDYMMIIGYTGNYDAPLSNFIGNTGTNNWYGVRDRDRDDEGFKFFVHDGEHSMAAGGGWSGANDRMNTRNSRQFRNDFTRSNPQFIHFDLGESTEEYRVRFADRAHAYLFNGGLLTPDRVLALSGERKAVVDQVIDIEAARWGDSKVSRPFGRTTWEREVERVLELEMRRRDMVFLSHLKRANLYPDTDAPEIQPFGGPIPASGNAVVTGSAGVLYVTTDGSDPRLVGGEVSGTALQVESGSPVGLTGSTNLRARALLDGEWSAIVETHFTEGIPASAANIVISEVNYHPAALTDAESGNPLIGDPDDLEFIELANVSGVAVELGGARFLKEADGSKLEGIDLTFAPLTMVPPGGRVVVVADAGAFSVRYPEVSPSTIAGDYSGRLDNGSDTIHLVAADGSTIARFRYSDGDPWPPAADGTGETLELDSVISGQDVTVAGAWKASGVQGGTPGGIPGGGFVGDPDADMDKDGFSAFLEFFFGTSDLVPGDGSPPEPGIVTDGGESYLEITFTRDPNSSAIAVIEISDDMKTWAPDPAGSILVGSSPVPGSNLVVETVQCRSPVILPGNRFVRLRAIGSGN